MGYRGARWVGRRRDHRSGDGLDKQYAHKISLVFNPRNDTFYMYYNAVPGGPDITGGRGIGLITSKPLPP